MRPQKKKTALKPSDAPESALRVRLGLDANAKIAGVDEAGRGAWAGPVYAAAVVLSPHTNPVLVRALDDSKRLSKSTREELSDFLHQEAGQKRAWLALASADLDEIATHNILGATLLAFARAVADLPCRPQGVLIDGAHLPRNLPCPAEPLVRGDSLSLAVAAAGIVAKVARDKEMQRLDCAYPAYGFARHQGYGTAAHRTALSRFGVSPVHRRTFRPIAHLVAKESPSTK